MVEQLYQLSDISEHGTIHIVLEKAEISLIKKMLKKKPSNFRIVGDQGFVYFIFCIEDQFKSKISNKWTSIDNWIYLKVPYGSTTSFKIQGTIDHFMDNFSMWLEVTSGNFYIDYYFRNDSDFAKEKGIFVQNLNFNDHRNKKELHINSYPLDRNNPFLESMTLFFPYPKGEKNNYTPSEDFHEIKIETKLSDKIEENNTELLIHS